MNFEKYSAEKSIVESGSTILFDPTSNFILKVSCDESFNLALSTKPNSPCKRC